MLLLLARGVTGEANELRHAAEDAGMRVQLLGSAEALSGVVQPGDSLLVMHEDLLPFCHEASSALVEDNCVIILDAGAGTRAGFERIDIDRAWGGALMIDGAALRGLSGLGGDFAPASALLRIALQQGTRQRRLDAGTLGSGEWQLVASDEHAARVEQLWLGHMLERPGLLRPTAWLAHRLLKPFAAGLASRTSARAGIAAVTVLALIGALAAVYLGHVAAGLGGILVAALLPEFARQLAQVSATPSAPSRNWPWLGWLVDGALVAALALPIEGSLHHMLFAPLMVGAALLLLDRASGPRWVTLVRDRGIVLVVALVASVLLPAEEAAMLLAALLTVFLLFSRLRERA
ncbi:hypothetical protein D2V17_06555 [Aurantiacibacter xanthus]|uniref:Uncharacterized protein n=1 Tax=Aurantiacibacter xanthus TaxID=1784712 RepID=A0A3A1P790_9SPHN|nr:hypothetical protein D2V17_06555 [Aurantiacibacter xanthus]